MKGLRESTGITYESLSRDLNSARGSAQPETTARPERKDNSTVTVKASRFVIAAYLFGAKFATGDVTEIPFCNEVHTITAKYIKSKRLMEERVQPAELFEFFDEQTPEYAELCRILDFGDGNGFNGEVAEKYFSDCIARLNLYSLDKRIDALKARLDGESSTASRKEYAAKLQQLIKQKEKLKSGEKK